MCFGVTPVAALLSRDFDAESMLSNPLPYHRRVWVHLDPDKPIGEVLVDENRPTMFWKNYSEKRVHLQRYSRHRPESVARNWVPPQNFAAAGATFVAVRPHIA